MNSFSQKNKKLQNPHKNPHKLANHNKTHKNKQNKFLEDKKRTL